MKKRNLYAGSLFSLLGVGFICGGIGNLLEIKSDDFKKNNPLNRDERYENFSLKKYFIDDNFGKKIQETTVENNKYIKELSRDLFVENFRNDFRKILGRIDRFKNKQNDYKIELNFLVENKKFILLDVVWFVPNTNHYFFDQLKIFLS